jgi:hypothetical protein
MKNRLFITFTTLLLVSCWNNKNNNQQTEDAAETAQENIEAVQFTESSYNKDKKIFDSEYPKYTINIRVQYAKGNSQVAQSINRQLVSFLFDNNIMPVKEALKHFGDSLTNDFEKELKEFYEPDNEYQETYAYDFTQKDSVSRKSPEGYVAYINRIETYTGGAHGGALENYINFHEDTGAMVTSEELFGKNKEAVCKLIKDQIVKDNDCKTAAELEEKRSIFSLGDVYISDNNFLLQKDGILFCFNPYEIAPWSEGFIFAVLTYQQLEGLISLNIVNNK